MKKKVLSLVLASAMVVSMAACGNSEAPASSEVASSEATSTESEASSETEEAMQSVVEAIAEMDYDAQSTYLYDHNLGEFYETYQAALEAETIAERFALMGIAEAKFLESAVMLPATTQGGMYELSKIAPYTNSPVLWGNDGDRFYSRVVVTEPITAEDRAALKAKYAELKGTGTYEQAVKDYLTEKGYTIKDSMNVGYVSDPQTWDILATSRSADTEPVVHTFDGLLEYDGENVQQPALAESYEVSEDGTVYTFKIREGVKWVDSQGREVADVKADDFVAGMQHMMDTMGGLEFLVQGVIVNASEYIDGTVTDFNEVGVKAVDDYTLEYHLVEPASYFTTMLGYSCFAPMSRSYYESQGGKFGAEYDSTAAYGSDPDHIAYCGPYLITNATEKNTIVYKANPSYWNADNVNIQTMTWLYNDGTDVTKAYNDFKAGTLDGVNLNTSTIELARTEGMFDQYAYLTDTNATTFSAFLTVNRTAYANVNDETALVSPQSEEDRARTMEALNNAHFRRAVCFSIDRGTYNAQVVGEELKLFSLRNSYTPGTFVTLPEEVTVDINGTATTFAAGANYGEIVQAQLDADGVKIKAWDPAANDGIGSSDGYDGWYNPANAVEELDAAIAELAGLGVVIDEANPIYLDFPYPSSDERYTNKAMALKKSVEEALGGKVIINMTDCTDKDQWYYAGYYTDYGYEANYNIYDLSGWGPDYGDPKTYLDTFLPDYAGYMVKCIGIF